MPILGLDDNTEMSEMHAVQLIFDDSKTRVIELDYVAENVVQLYVCWSIASFDIISNGSSFSLKEIGSSYRIQDSMVTLIEEMILATGFSYDVLEEFLNYLTKIGETGRLTHHSVEDSQKSNLLLQDNEFLTIFCWFYNNPKDEEKHEPSSTKLTGNR